MYHKNCSKTLDYIIDDLERCVMCCLQAWSITYVSWLTFVFLIWSCMLWMVRDRRRYAMLSSPFMVAYGNLLIVLQYIWSFENMEPISGLFVEKKNPFHSLSSKVWKQQWRATQSDRAYATICNYHAFSHLNNTLQSSTSSTASKPSNDDVIR